MVADTGTTTASYVVNNSSNTWYCYQVAALTDEGAVSGYSNEAGPTRRSVASPNAPSGLGPTRGTNQVTLAWTAPTNAVDAAVSGYRVQRRAATNATTCGTAAWSNVVADTGTTTASYVVNNSSNTWYCYQVAALTDEGAVSGYSNQAGPTRRTIATPGASSNLIAVKGPSNNRISFTWTGPANATDSSVTAYRIQRRTATSATVCGTGTWSNAIATTGSSTTSYTDYAASNGNYCYQVAALNNEVTPVVGAYSPQFGPFSR